MYGLADLPEFRTLKAPVGIMLVTDEGSNGDVTTPDLIVNSKPLNNLRH